MNPTMSFPEDLVLESKAPEGIPLSVDQMIEATIDGVETMAKVLGFATLGFVVELPDGRRGYIDYPKDVTEIRHVPMEPPHAEEFLTESDLPPAPAACERPDTHWWGDESTAEQGGATPNECRICGVARDSFPMLNNGLRLGEHADDCAAGLHGDSECDCSGSLTLAEATDLGLLDELKPEEQAIAEEVQAPAVAPLDPMPSTATSSEPASVAGDEAARELEEMAAAIQPPAPEPEPAPPAPEATKSEVAEADKPKGYSRPKRLPKTLNGLIPEKWNTNTPKEHPVTKVAAWLKQDMEIDGLVKRMLSIIDENKQAITDVQVELKRKIPFNNPIHLREMFLTLEGNQYLMHEIHAEAEALLDKAEELLLMPPGTSVMCRGESGELVPATGCKVKNPDDPDFMPRYKELTETYVSTYLAADVAAFRRFRNEMKAVTVTLDNRLFNIKAFQRDGGM